MDDDWGHPIYGNPLISILEAVKSAKEQSLQPAPVLKGASTSQLEWLVVPNPPETYYITLSTSKS